MDHKFISSKSFFAKVKKVVYLVNNLWKEGTTALLHAPRTVDKTAQALSIAADLAEQGRKVLYVNSEDRLPEDFRGHDNLLIFNPEYESIDDTTDYADLIVEAIEQAVRNSNIHVFVIDSISRIAALSFGRNASAAYVMKRLVALQVKCKLSILVVADDTTKTVNNALLTLASCEIPLDPDCESRHQPVISAQQPIEDSRPSATFRATKTTSAPTKTPAPMMVQLPPLNRRERREMERRNAKLAKRQAYKTLSA